ncbi:FkbM family methyltransferase [Bradyrhizobium cytisi]|uniref:FkbM family methyltransferase n=1 Tax=Bradyrhizobium cytisi TaxID=515489 RepID=A0A5S4WYZ3_9BRAD|nr:FkbM family methyltransferase [Bradyrhizobium cytisi]TYL85912.1 FkbM family methyltransferase [Bradyrhizobium cytisi]
MISYSQNFEDVLLARMFQGQSNGFYIDVGAWDPTRHSVTRHFYDQGWAGVNIEPVQRQFQLFVDERPRDQNLNLAVADFGGRVRFYECNELTSLSTANEAQAEELRRSGYNVVDYEVPVVTLEEVIADCGDRIIDFLKIDVEGFEAAVLRGVDLKRRRPRVLVIEATLPSVKIEDWDEADSIRNWDDWEPAVLAADYELAGYDGLSRFYLRKEDAHLRKRLFLPPCVHDGFELAEVHEVKRTHQVLLKEREDVLNANRRLEDELRAVESDRAEKARVLERIERELVELKSSQLALTKEREDVLDVNERLASELRAVDEDRTAKAFNLESLAAEISALGEIRQQLLDERENVLNINQSLENQLRSVEADQTSKADVIARLARQITESAGAQQLLTEERDNLLNANARLESELRAVSADRTEKGVTIERLVGEVAELKTDRQALVEARDNALKATQRLEADLAAVEADRAEKSQVINRLKIDLERASVENAIQSQKLVAKDHVLELAALRELKGKAVLRGFADLQLRRKHNPPGYGDYIPSEASGGGLHVAIDALEIVFGVSGGVETYMKMLTSALLEGGRRVTLICLPDQVPPLRRLFGARVSYFVMRRSLAVGLAIDVPKRLFGHSRRLSAATSMATFSRLQEDIGVDVLHSPVQIFSLLDFRIPSVLNLHDLQHLHFPENFRPTDIEARNRLYSLSASLADAIVVSSDFVRDDLITQMQVPPAKVFTVPVTWDPRVVAGLGTFSVQDAASRYKLPPTYVVYPAQFWSHKNHARLVQALRIVRDKRPNVDLKLVFTGYRGHSGWPAVRATIEKLGLGSHVICLDHVPVDHLAAIYKGALYCVVPSTFEASSYPIIEAQVLGVPAMCSNVTSLPELMQGGAGLLFDPFDVEDIAAKMLRWLDYPDDRRAHAQRALAKASEDHGIQKYVTGLAEAYDYARRDRSGRGNSRAAAVPG